VTDVTDSPYITAYARVNGQSVKAWHICHKADSTHGWSYDGPPGLRFRSVFDVEVLGKEVNTPKPAG
jgi:hypothetical protein